jgi:Nif-specific regulatory protein
VQCAYCDRSGDCSNNSPRGHESVLLTPQQAISFAQEALAREPRIVCAGVSGPGDALANSDATFETLSGLRALYPKLPFFIATNGLSLVEHADRLNELGVRLCTVTINAVDPAVLSRLIDWIAAPRGILTGEESARFLIARQLDGIRALAERDVTVRVNVQLIPSINGGEIEAIAKATALSGARFFHVQPFEPSQARKGAPATFLAPNKGEVDAARALAAKHLELVAHCSLCPSDSLGCLAGTKTEAIRSALLSSSLQQDPISTRAAGKIVDAGPELAEKGVALRQLQLIARVARLLSTSEDDTLTTLRRVLVWLDEQLDLKRAVLTLIDVAGETLSAQVTHDVDPEQEDRMRYRPDEGVTGQVFATGKAILLPSLQAEPNFLDRSGLRAGLDLSKLAFFCVPIRDRGSVIGTLSADKQNSLLKDADSDLAFLEEVAQLLAPFVQRRRLEESLSMFRRLRSSEGAASRLIGRSGVMEEVRRLIAKVAAANTTVLFTGETGTGKSAAATLLHELSMRAKEPFIEVNCGAIPDNLIESELFGHEKGAFTGAIQRRLGVFERARGGTVFLDEIGELGPSAQTRLLRVLQTRRYERVGGTETLTTDARLIAATNRDLASAVADGTFRADLYYRLNVFPIVMPPLRERGNADIMLLADSFIDRHGKAMAKPIFRVDTPAIDMLTAYHWPGNVRELENVIERAVVLAEADVIHGHHLPPSLQMNRYSPSPEALDFASRVSAFEIELITEALKDVNGNQTKAAARLGITKRVIQYKIRTYDIPWERFLPKR